jgi:ligand-binding sensor domain-containing protein/two-component sensor histidine kinase
LIACATGDHCFAQQNKPEQYRAIHWTKDDGLPSASTYTVFKDERGFLWIGGGGSYNSELCRFDGAVFKKYLPDRPERRRRGAISSDNIYAFKEDSLHNIWMGTGTGISRYDMKADTFTNFSPFIDSAFSFSNSTIAPIWATNDEMYCMEPGGAITAINIHTLKREKILQLSVTNRPEINWNTNKSFFDKSSMSFWFLCGGPMMEQIFLDGKVLFYTWPCYEDKASHGHHRHNAEDMCYDPSRNSVWINSGEGLLEFSLTDKQFRKVEAWNKLTKQKSYDRGVGVDIDRQGRVWFSTYAEGIFIYDPETEQAKPLFSDHDMQLKTGEANLHIYCDRDSIVWTADWLGKGIYELLPFKSLIKRYAPNPSAKNALSNGLISMIVPGPQGKLWLGTADGLNIFDPVTETFEVLREKDLPGIKGTSILPLYIDTIQQKALLNAGSPETDKQYLAMSMYEMDIKTRKCSRIVFMDGSKRIDSFSVMPGWQKPYKGGIIFCDELHGVFEIKEGSLVANLLIPLVPGGSGFGNILLAEDRYLFLDHGSTPPNFAFENKNGKWTRVPNVLDYLGWFSALYNKKDQTYWVSEVNGLVHYNKEFGLIKSYIKEDGYNGFVVNMQLDNYGNLWFASGSQIGRLNTATGTFSNFSGTDGEKRDFEWMAPITKDGRGDMYFGIGAKNTGTDDSKWGLDRVFPERFSSVTSAVYLNTLSINQKPFSPFAQVNELEELSLKYDQNTIRIEAGIIDFYSRKKGLIRYKLEQNGKEGDWQYPPDYIIRYDGLLPGSYRLVVQSSNVSNNEFNSPEKILVINISPAFWNTWWFRTIAIMSVFGFFYAAIRYRTKQKFRRQLERLEKGREVAELRQQKTEMEMQALRAQMNPHFIFNSLNSINRFILQNNKAQASEYLTKFSKLVRMILQNSQASLISLEAELEALGLYLEMEALRFNYHFDYTITTSKDLDIEVLQVPPLILQPYVENAIWHGLMHKEEKGHLDIDISEKDDQIFLKIKDNGVGREKAKAMASKSATKHKSMGLRITENRIAILQKNASQESPITIHDLVNDDGIGAGTEVVIKMPLIYD